VRMFEQRTSRTSDVTRQLNVLDIGPLGEQGDAVTVEPQHVDQMRSRHAVEGLPSIGMLDDYLLVAARRPVTEELVALLFERPWRDQFVRVADDPHPPLRVVRPSCRGLEAGDLRRHATFVTRGERRGGRSGRYATEIRRQQSPLR